MKKQSLRSWNAAPNVKPARPARDGWFVGALAVILIGTLSLITACGRDTTNETSDSSTGQSAAQQESHNGGLLDRLMPDTSHDVTLPAGTLLSVTLAESVGSATSNAGDTIQARTTSDVRVNGEVVVPAGSEVTGRVIEAVSLKKIGGRPKLTLQFVSVKPPEGDTALINASYSAVGKSETKKDAATIAGSAVGGAILGRIIGHKHGEEARGTAIGGVVGGAAGTAVAAATKGEEIVLPAGSVLQVHLQAPVEIST